MTKKNDRTYAFRPISDGRWQVLVFVAGKKGVQRFHQIKLLTMRSEDNRTVPICNCKAKWYNSQKKCRHEVAFEDYASLASFWLSCNDPDKEECIADWKE